jgi:hypothetical protein
MTKFLAMFSMIMMPLSSFGQAGTAAEQDRNLRLNQIQVIGSHNSYHSGIAPSEHKLIEHQNPKAMRALDYAHAPLADQLSGGVRQLEIDIYADTKGGRYAHPAIVEKVAEAGLPADPDFDPQHEMDKPGFKVMVATAPATSADLSSTRNQTGSRRRASLSPWARAVYVGHLRCAGCRDTLCLFRGRDDYARPGSWQLQHVAGGNSICRSKR